MSGGKKGSAFLEGELTKVDVAAIEKQLKELWQNSLEGDEDSNSIMRACSSNFILLTDSDESAVDETLSEILAQHPSRAVLAIFKLDQESQVNAWVSARCHLATAKGQDKVCSEQITVHAKGGSTEQLASVIRPLIVADLPVFLWWRMPKLDNELLRPLASMADALIVDSNADPFDYEFLASVQPMATNRSRLKALDLNWMRLNAWQRALANAFDGYPLEVFDLANIESVAIHYAGSKDGRISNQALLLASWMSSRLRWTSAKKVAPNKASFQQASGGERSIEFIATKSYDVENDSEGDILEVAASLTEQRSLAVKPEAAGEHGAMVARLYAGKSLESETTPAKLNISDAQLVVQQLEITAFDVVFAESLNQAVEFGKTLK